MGLVKVKWEFPDWAARFKSKIPEILNVAAATLQTNRGMLFDHSGAYNGHQAWVKPRLRSGQPLSARGALRQSFAPINDGSTPVRARDGIVEIVGERITIGTTLVYAKILNDGGIIRPVKAKALMIPLPSGKRASTDAKSLRKESIGRNDLQDALDRYKRAYRVSQGKEKQEYLDKIQTLVDKLHKVKKNDRFIFRKKVTIPARDFTSWTAQDAEEMAETLKNKILQVMNGAD